MALVASVMANVILLVGLTRIPEPPPPSPRSMPGVDVLSTPVPEPVTASAPAPCALDHAVLALPPSQWTTSTTHVGPFRACMRRDLAELSLLLGYGYTFVVRPFGSDHALYDVVVHAPAGAIVTLPLLNHVDRALMVRVLDRRIATPAGDRVGDRLRDVAARNPQLRCAYIDVDYSHGVTCFAGDTWSFELSLSSLTREGRALIEESYGRDLPIERLGYLPVLEITWTAPAPAAT